MLFIVFFGHRKEFKDSNLLNNKRNDRANNAIKINTIIKYCKNSNRFSLSLLDLLIIPIDVKKDKNSNDVNIFAMPLSGHNSRGKNAAPEIEDIKPNLHPNAIEASIGKSKDQGISILTLPIML
jgi:hypothetical protein